jgi:two-component system cell cycle sensor histidine kinase/response regulator CckA
LPTTSPIERVTQTWQVLTKPADEIQDPLERRNAKFILSWMAVGVPVSLAVILVLPWTDPATDGLTGLHSLFVLFGLGIYLLARTKHYYMACVLEVLILWLGTTFMAVALPDQGHSLGFLIVPILLSASVLSKRLLNLFAAVSLLTIPGVVPLLPEPDLHGLLHSGLLLLAGNVFIVTARMHRDRQMEASAQVLREREARHRHLLEAAYDGTALVRADHIVEASKGFAEVFDRDPATLLGLSLSELFAAESRDEIQRSLSQATSPPIETRTRTSGKQRWVELVSQASTDLNGLSISLIAVRDVTERRDLQNQLLFADRMMSMGTLAAGVAHEINNPLTYIMAGQKSLSSEIPPMLRHIDPAMLHSVQRKMDLMGEGLDRVRQIVQDLATFSRVDERQPGCVDVHLVADSAVNMAWNEIRHRAQLIKEYDPVPALEINDAKLGQVVLNLLINAAQALPDGQAESMRIRLTTSTNESGMAVIEVADTGPGIPEEIVNRIFEPFFTTKPVGQGTGLGLSVCHFIVSNAGGTLTVDTSPQGTCFRLLLPAAEHLIEDMPTPEFDEINADHQKTRVLVVDDEPAIATLLGDMLEDYSVVQATSGREAISTWKEGEFDVIICDLMMPDISGIEVYKFLENRDQGEEERIIFLTGGAFSPASRSFLNEMSNMLIRKPFTRDEIRRAIARAPGGPGQ